MGVCTIERAFDIYQPASCTYIFSEIANVRSPQVRHRTLVRSNARSVSRETFGTGWDAQPNACSNAE